ncbi:MAG TPA: glutathione S-transferase N-terminal domain-containing protein [Myxococcota bacterium]|jgi:glutathione S-transferase
MNRALDVATSLAATLARGGVGLTVAALGPRPEKPLELYEFEACPFCRKAREALTALDLDALVLPCPKGGPRFREEVKRRGGKYQFPYLVDPNTGKEMYESDEIVAYLFERYGAGRPPLLLSPGALTNLSAGLASALRPGFGSRYRPARAPELPLELWSFEASPFCRIVRECLSSLELPYRLHNVGKGSPKRAAFRERSGKMMVPWLVDPNTGASMFESADIVRYLERTYAKPGA